MMTFRIKRILNPSVVLCLLAGLGISSAQAAPSDHFATTWKTDNPGQSNNTSITIPMYGGPYNVDWDNDGTFDEFGLYGSVTHDFGVAGTYTIRIDGSYTRIFFFDTGDKDKIVSLEQWGTQTWTSMRMAFYGCSNLEIPAADTPDFSAVTDMDYMFALAPLANPDTGGWDTSSVTNMNLMFFGASSANPDTSGWDTSSVTQMISMFESATAANPDTSGWDTSLVTDMNHMFFDATAANPDTSGWVTSSVTSMQSMFEGATAANPDTSGWDTSLVTSMHSMFFGATAANPDTSGWDTSSVDLMGSLFEGATAANPDTSGWNTSSVVNMNYMFSRASAANPDTSGWDTSSVTGMRYMFSYATSVNPDTGGWDTSSVTNMRNMFYQATSANPDTSGWDMSRVTDTRYMFRGVTLSRPNYEALLINWNAQVLRSGLTFDGGNSTYCSNAAANARANMINADGWTITDGGPDCAGQASPPTVVTSSASSIGTTGARLNGTADPNGASSSAWFQWGTSAGYGNVTSPQTNVGSGTSAVSYYFNLGALQCGTIYHFRAVAQNSDGTAYGSDRSFTTAACPAPPPTVVTSSASSIGTTGVRLNGTADPNGASSSAWFQWGTSTGYGNVTSPQTNVGSGTSAVSYYFNLGALQCGTIYHFRAVAQNSGGTAYGNDRSFTTAACPAPPPTVVTSSASSIGTTGVRLNGTADPNGASSSAWFQWGTSTGYGNVTSPQTNVGSGTSAVSYYFNLGALQCGTIYHFRAVAQNSGGTAYGNDRSFTTAACPAPPPTVVTSSASSIGTTGVRLNGTADPNAASSSAWFQWGTSTGYGNVTSPQTNVGSGTSAVSYYFNLGALQCGTVYHFRAVAQNSGGTAYGNDRSFTTAACPAPPPTVVTSSASSIGTTGVRLNGTADPNGASSSAWFQWGTSAAYGNVTSPQTNVGSGTSAVSYYFNLGALACGTTYHFRAVAENSGGTAYGSDRSFTTSACSTTTPTVVTSPASSIGATWARLNGTADPNGAATSAWFEWGTSAAYGNTTVPGTDVGSGTSPVEYAFLLGTLTCGTTYHFRAVAENSGGTAYGSDRSFTTSACEGSTQPPTLVTSPASSISATVARLNGTADPNGASTSAWFEWGTSTGYGNATAPATNVGSGTSPVSYAFDLGALACGTTYHFRAVAENSGGAAYGTDRSFTTSACSTPPPTVVTSPASSISDSGARLNGTADPNGASTSAWFEWGISTAYGNVTAPATNVGSGTSPVSYSFDFGGLQCDTTYHFRAVAENSGGTAYGNDRSFTTSACTTQLFTVGGTASGLSGSGLVLRNSGGDPLTISGNGSFTFNTPLEDGSAYSVSVWIQPTGPDQTCSVANGTGTISGVDITNVSVTCVTDPGQEHVLLDSGFETGSKEGWSSKGKVSVDGFLAVDQYSLRHGKGAKSVYSLMTAGYEDVSVTMHLAATSLKSGDACIAEVSTDGGDSWMPVVTLQDGQDSGAFLSGTVFPPDADDILDVKLRFRSSGKRNRGYCYGDEVYVTGTLIGG